MNFRQRVQRPIEAKAISLAIAILRYRFYDIDILINRTVVYSLLISSLVLAQFILNTLASRIAP